MADYATNLFFASTENERDLDKVEAFLDDNFADCFIERSEDMLDAQFSSDRPKVDVQDGNVERYNGRI